MFVDSHCHLDFPEFTEDFAQIRQNMQDNDVGAALCISVNSPDWPNVLKLAETYDNFWASVGVHPAYDDTPEVEYDWLIDKASHPRVVAIGETGLDYFRLKEPLDWQRDRFRTHIRAAVEADVPLIIHTRNAPDDTLKILREEGADRCRGVIHCFSEDWDFAQQAMDLGFYISFSGIVTFKKAKVIQDAATKVPLDRILIETDSPFLAPVPFRGKRNDPSLVIHIAHKLAELKSLPVEDIEKASTDNFFKLFKKTSRSEIQA